jgi:predicted transposase/invertase (TIGR01784 family)
MSKNNQTYDTPWKEILEVFFRQFMEFFVPGSEKDIDWSVAVKFLDKELQKLTKDSVVSRRHTDKLIEVTLKDNTKKWILIHIEVQSQRDLNFSERMFVYNYRVYDRYKIPVTSVAILADDSLSWRPAPFQYGMWGSTMGLDYLKTKLLDYKQNWDYLKKEDNPFAIVVMAHLKALETRKDHSLRKQWKIELTKLLYGKGYSEKEVLNLYSFIDWVLTLPEALEKCFLEDLKQYEKEENMPYITSAVRIGRQEGREDTKEKLLSFVRRSHQQGITVETIAKIVQMDISMVNSILNNKKVDIPLHLLNYTE